MQNKPSLRFLVLWTLSSSVCLLVAGGVENWNSGTHWNEYANQLYLIYWSLLGLCQGGVLLLFRFYDLAMPWFLTTSVAGFLIMRLPQAILLSASQLDSYPLIFISILMFLLTLLAGGAILSAIQWHMVLAYRVNRDRNHHEGRLVSPSQHKQDMGGWIMQGMVAWWISAIATVAIILITVNMTVLPNVPKDYARYLSIASGSLAGSAIKGLAMINQLFPSTD